MPARAFDQQQSTLVEKAIAAISTLAKVSAVLLLSLKLTSFFASLSSISLVSASDHCALAFFSVLRLVTHAYSSVFSFCLFRCAL